MASGFGIQAIAGAPSSSSSIGQKPINQLACPMKNIFIVSPTIADRNSRQFCNRPSHTVSPPTIKPFVLWLLSVASPSTVKPIVLWLLSLAAHMRSFRLSQRLTDLTSLKTRSTTIPANRSKTNQPAKRSDEPKNRQSSGQGHHINVAARCAVSSKRNVTHRTIRCGPLFNFTAIGDHDRSAKHIVRAQRVHSGRSHPTEISNH